MDLAIVGAGAAGASVAYALRNRPVAVTVVEAAEAVGGRAATRRRNGCRYDYGANYVKPDSDRVSELLTETLPTEGLVDVEEPVWTFDGGGEIGPGDEPEAHKWTYRQGICEFVELLFGATDAEIETGAEVSKLARDGEYWRLVGVGGVDLGRYDALVLTPPAPRTAELLAAVTRNDRRLGELREAAAAVPYRTIYSVVLHYPFDVDYPWYALVNADRTHEIGWLAREELKAGHVPGGETLLIAQMAPDWSADRYGDDPGSVATDAASLVAELLDDERFVDPDWTDHEAWRNALPNAGADVDALRCVEDEGLYAAGDWVAGDGRVHLAVESGLDVGERIAAAVDG